MKSLLIQIRITHKHKEIFTFFFYKRIWCLKKKEGKKRLKFISSKIAYHSPVAFVGDSQLLLLFLTKKLNKNKIWDQELVAIDFFPSRYYREGGRTNLIKFF